MTLRAFFFLRAWNEPSPIRPSGHFDAGARRRGSILRLMFGVFGDAYPRDSFCDDSNRPDVTTVRSAALIVCTLPMPYISNVRMMRNTTDTHLETTLAASVAGEDITCGDFIAVMNEVVELPSYLWSGCDISLPSDEPVRLRFLPCDAGEPRKVIAVCLPFVYAKKPNGSVVTLDVRRYQLLRLDRVCARAAWKARKPSKKRRR